MTKSSHVFLADLKGKADIEGVYFIKFIALFEAKDGKKYINIVLSDSSGEIEGRIWHNGEEIAKHFKKSDFVLVKAKLNHYQGRRQLIISEIDPVEQNKVDLDLYVRKAKEKPELMYEKLEAIVSGLDDYYIRNLLQLVLKDKEITKRLLKWQAGKSIHHAYQSGLLEHILSCSELAVSLSGHFKVNKNYVVAGAILHDLCKIYELSDGLAVEYTEEGKLVGHLVKGLEVVDRFAYKIKNFPYHTKLHLKHILLSHHGQYEFGSPKVPLTKEAYLVHYIDLMDSKMNAIDTIKTQDAQTGHWSNYIKHLDRMVYKADLPFYGEPIDDADAAGSPKNRKGHVGQKDLKQNLGDLLKDIKVKS
jgi:3'-5' exoribonuclease